jgi:hypothetical protein
MGNIIFVKYLKLSEGRQLNRFDGDFINKSDFKSDFNKMIELLIFNIHWRQDVCDFPLLKIRAAAATLGRQEQLAGVAVSGCDVTSTGTLNMVLHLKETVVENEWTSRDILVNKSDAVFNNLMIQTYKMENMVKPYSFFYINPIFQSSFVRIRLRS